MHLKSTIYESTLSTADAVPLPRVGKAKRRRLRRPKKGSQPRRAALGSPIQGQGRAWILPPSDGRRCPEGAEVGWGWRYEKERGDRLKYAINESTLSTADAVPLPQWGRLRYENTAIPETQPSPRGEGKEDRRGAPHYYLRRSRCHNPQPTTHNPEPLNLSTTLYICIK